MVCDRGRREKGPAFIEHCVLGRCVGIVDLVVRSRCSAALRRTVGDGHSREHRGRIIELEYRDEGSELRALAVGIRHDLDTVLLAIFFERSNGRVDGLVNHLELLKRTRSGDQGSTFFAAVCSLPEAHRRESGRARQHHQVGGRPNIQSPATRKS